MQQICRRAPMPKSDFNKAAKQLYWNHTCRHGWSLINLLHIFRAHFPRTHLERCVWRLCFFKARIHCKIVLWNYFMNHSFNVYFITSSLITFNLISWNSYKICKKEASTNYDQDRKKMNTKENQAFNLLLIELISF